MANRQREPVRAATIYDVARLAGVSHQTVSRLLAGFEGIRPATRSRVESAIVELDYKPNQTARLLRMQKSNRIGALAHEMGETGPGRIVQGASRGAREQGYVLDIVAMDGQDEKSVIEALTLLSHQQLSGIFATAQTDQVKAVLERFPLSVPIYIDSRIDSANSADGLGENGRSGALAARHLLDLGHRRVALLTGPLEWLASRDRRDGFLAELARGGGECVLTVEGDWSPASGFKAGSELPMDRGITAVSTGNDDMALGVLSALSARGIRVPEDLSLIGFDDIPEAAYLLPPLTTVRMDFEAEGRYAIGWLIAEIEGREHDASAIAPASELVIRGSTAPPRP